MGRARAAAFVASSFTKIDEDFDLRTLYPNKPPEEEQTEEHIVRTFESWPAPPLPT